MDKSIGCEKSNETVCSNKIKMKIQFYLRKRKYV
jgi:hypothetical protein